MKKSPVPPAVRILALVPILCMGQASAPEGTLTEIQRSSFWRSPYQETAGLLNDIPGMWVKDLGQQGQWNPVRYRGGDFTHSTLLLNGFEFNDPWTGLPDVNFIPQAWVDSVKCYPAMNPAGLSAIGAVMDIASGIEPSQRPLTEIAYEKTSDGFGRTCASFSKAVSSRLTLRAAAAFRKYGEGLHFPESDDNTIYGQARFRLSGQWRMDYFFGRAGTESDLPFRGIAPGDTSFLDQFRFRRNQTHHIMTVSSVFLDTRLSVRHDAYDYRIEGRREFTAPKTSIRLLQSWNGPLPLSWGFQSEWVELKTAGFESGNRWTGRVFAATHARLLPGLLARIQAGVHGSREGRASLLGSGLVNWTASEAMNAWMSVHQGIRDPALGEWTGCDFLPFPAITFEKTPTLFPDALSVPNRRLLPERSVNAEGGIEIRLPSRMRLRLCAFGRNVERTIELSPSGGFRNGAGQRFWGAESSVELGPWHHVSARGAVNYLKSENPRGGILFDRPNFHGSGEVTWMGSFFSDDLAPAVSMRLRSWSEFWNSATRNAETAAVLIPFASLLDVKVSATIMKKASVYWMIENVIGTRAWSVADFPLPVRLTTFGLTWELFD
jgi:hypothetical protein